MHRLFADWYRMVDPDPSPEALSRRWTCVETLAQRLTPTTVLDVVAAFLNAPGKTWTSGVGKSSQAFVDVFKGADSSFPVEGNAELLRVMLGAVAACVINGGADRLATVCALALRTSRCQGAVSGLVKPASVLVEAESFLSQRGASKRAGAMAPPVDIRALKGKQIKVDTKRPVVADAGEFGAANANDKALAGSIEALATTVEQLRAMVVDLQEQANVAVQALQARVSDPAIPVLKEETEVLWWLFAERSVDLDCGFTALPNPGGALIVAKELADRTRVLPAPPSAPAFIRRALAPTGPDVIHTLAAMVAGTPPDWRRQLVPSIDLGGLAPVLVTVTRSIDDEITDWQSSNDRATGVQAAQELSASQWSRQLYDEILLVRAVQNA